MTNFFSRNTLYTFIGLLALNLSVVSGYAQSPADSAHTDSASWPVRVFNKFFGDEVPPGKPQFLVYPTLAFTPETSVEFGLSALYLYNARRDPVNSRISEISVFTFITLEQQYGLWMEHALYNYKDAWAFLGRVRWQRFPLLYYGIGPQTPPEFPAVAGADYFLLRERILRRVYRQLFIGPSIDFQYLYNVDFVREPENMLPLPLGVEGTSNLGLGLSLVYDTRHNVLNVRKGWYAEASYLEYQPAWGSEFTFRSFTFDGRAYFPVTADKKQVLATQIYGNFIGGDAPFHQLSLLGNESLMRGYYTGRFRDQHYIAAQAEYRFLPLPFSKRFGATVFMGVGAVSPAVSQWNLDQWKPAGGIGIRYLLFPQKDIFVRFDVAMTPEGPNFYIFSGEAF